MLWNRYWSSRADSEQQIDYEVGAVLHRRARKKKKRIRHDFNISVSKVRKEKTTAADKEVLLLKITVLPVVDQRDDGTLQDL